MRLVVLHSLVAGRLSDSAIIAPVQTMKEKHLLSLVKAAQTGDHAIMSMAVQEFKEEASTKADIVLADQLLEIIASAPDNKTGQPASAPSEQTSKNALKPPLPQLAQTSNYLSEITPRTELDDLVLADDCRTIITQMIQELAHAEQLQAAGVEPRHKVLLLGPPGNGKTSLAEAIAYELWVPLLKLNYDAMIDSYLGNTGKRMQEVFEIASQQSCVLLLDEFDAIGKERGDQNETGEMRRLVSSLLLWIDALPCHTVIVAASNHDSQFDRAIWRRFQLRLRLEPPSECGLGEYLARRWQDMNIVTDPVPVDVARQLGPVSYAEAEEFSLDVRRQIILAEGSMSDSEILADVLAGWKERSVPVSA